MGKWILAVSLSILVVEILGGRLRAASSKREITLNGLSAAINLIVSRPLAAITVAYLMKALFPGGAGALANVPFWIAFPTLMLVTDFCFYWGHRWAHAGQSNPRLRWLWRLHHTHHSAEYMSILLTVRQNIFWIFVVPTTWVLGFAAFLGQEKAAALTAAVIYGWNLFTHCYYRWDDHLRNSAVFARPYQALEHLLTTPGLHHTHHGYGRDGAMYRNFAVSFSALDWVFGTLHIPKGRPARYGVPGSDLTVVEDLFYPLAPGRRNTSSTSSAA